MGTKHDTPFTIVAVCGACPPLGCVPPTQDVGRVLYEVDDNDQCLGSVTEFSSEQTSVTPPICVDDMRVMTSGEIGCPPHNIVINNVQSSRSIGGGWSATYRDQVYYCSVSRRGEASCALSSDPPLSTQGGGGHGAVQSTLNSMAPRVRECFGSGVAAPGTTRVTIRLFRDGGAVLLAVEPDVAENAGDCLDHLVGDTRFPRREFVEILEATFPPSADQSGEGVSFSYH